MLMKEVDSYVLVVTLACVELVIPGLNRGNRRILLNWDPYWSQSQPSSLTDPSTSIILETRPRVQIEKQKK